MQNKDLKATLTEKFLVNDLPYCISWLNKENIYLGCNQLFSRINGLKNPQSIIGKSTAQLPYYAKFPDLITQIEKNNLVVLESKIPQSFEELWIENDKQSTWVVQKIPVLQKKDVILLVIAFNANTFNGKDINNLYSKDILENIVANMPGHVYWKNTEGVYLGCNDKQAKSLGLNHGYDVVGKTDLELPWPKEAAQKFRENDLHIMQSGETQLFEEPSTVDGKSATVLSLKSPLKNNQTNQIIGVMGISIDITHQKEVEKALIKAKETAETANKAKTEFLENMRHDIRTPLTGIIGFAELIRNEVTDPKMKEYASNLVASGQALTDLLNEVLEIIKVNSGEIPVLKKKFNLQKKLNEIILLNQAKAQHKKIDLSFVYDPAIPNYLIGDSVRIHRVVLELVINALNFTHQGYVKLSVQSAKNNEDDIVLKIIVEDTGIGIPPEKQQEIYLQFKRLTPSYEGIYKGYGLGLSIAKQLIDDLGGEIYVESQIGVGSKFTLILKLKKALLDENLGSEDLISLCTSASHQLIQPQKSEAALTTKATPVSYKSRILVVEDSPIAARVVTEMLCNMDCAVDLAEKGQAAVDMTKDNLYDLIFMDIGLPDIDGYEVTKRIRLNEFKKNHVPIIALTAHASEENKKGCIDIGMNAVLTKPLVQEKAEDILNSFIPYRRERLNLKKLPDTLAEAETSQQAALAIFNFEELKTLFGHNEQRAIDTVTFFLEKELPQELQAIQAAHSKNDWLLIQGLAHKLKGGVSYCCALRLKEACDQLESAIRKGENEHLENLYTQLLKIAKLTEKTMKEVFRE